MTAKQDMHPMITILKENKLQISSYPIPKVWVMLR